MEKRKRWNYRAQIANIRIICLIIAFTAVMLCLNSYLSNVEAASVDATVGISVCGDDLKGGGEECDNTDLDGKSCSSFGYNAGTLTCNPDCSFNTSQCSIVDTGGGDDGDDDGDSSSKSGSSTSTDSTGSDSDSETSIVELAATFLLPERIKRFDFNNNEKIDLSELFAVFKSWVDFWRSGRGDSCDVNFDGRCDLRDFSILLYFVER